MVKVERYTWDTTLHFYDGAIGLGSYSYYFDSVAHSNYVISIGLPPEIRDSMLDDPVEYLYKPIYQGSSVSGAGMGFDTPKVCLLALADYV